MASPVVVMVVFFVMDVFVVVVPGEPVGRAELSKVAASTALTRPTAEPLRG
ncbi:hypothetical protein G5T42_12435 [Microbacterium sp. 4R-513]|uniref:hypothetical protein n=1 Tax=Microbacterium sp. 4R-513 TaxID=2567934 RepID=UPI0013E191D6|nr:hypothetical protein [Microbacterium sp. 4R-513]QIG40190.1 hypothetical protein G5T42_12435 [Microbacterium sp. 4R-513]